MGFSAGAPQRQAVSALFLRVRPWIFGEFCDQDGFRDFDAIRAASGGTPWWMSEDIPVRSWRPEVQALIEAPRRLAEAAPGFSHAELLRVAHAQALMVRKFWLEAVRRRPEVRASGSAATPEPGTRRETLRPELRRGADMRPMLPRPSVNTEVPSTTGCRLPA